MRRLKNEDGFSLVLIAILLIVLMAFAGFAVDAGAMYQERRELRNGADAAALAIAQACAEDPSDPDCSDDTGDDSPARRYANLNADDGHSAVDSVVIDLSPPAPYTVTVKVVTSAEDDDGEPGFPMRFMQVLGIDSVDVRATATAAVGSPIETPTPPVVFEECEWARAFGGTPPSSFPSPEVALFLHQAPLPKPIPDCPVNLDPAGKDAPGAFGFIGGDGDCSALIIAGYTETSVGNKPPQPECKPDDIYRRLFTSDVDGDGYGETIPIPIFDTLTGQGSNVTYHIAGIGMFETRAYNLAGQYVYPLGFECPDNPETPQADNNATCIVGRFTEGFLRDLGRFGGEDYGAILVRLID